MADATTKELSLAKTYRRMATEEIERRISAGDLTPLAATVAVEELRRRQGGGEMAAPAAGEEESPWPLIVLFVIQAVVVFGFSMLFLRDMLGMVAAVELPILAALIGKAFPRLGLIIGCLLVPFPLYTAISLWVLPSR